MDHVLCSVSFLIGTFRLLALKIIIDISKLKNVILLVYVYFIFKTGFSILSLFLGFIYFYLKDRAYTETRRDREKGPESPDSFRDDCNADSWADSNPETYSFFRTFHVGTGWQALGSYFSAYTDTSAESWVRNGAVGTHMGCQDHIQRLNLLTEALPPLFFLGSCVHPC